MARDIDSYLRELQAALASAGADPAVAQDALFDAEEHLRAEMAGGSDFPTVAENYGAPEEVAAAYLGMTPASGATPQMAEAPPVVPMPPAEATVPAAAAGAAKQPGVWAQFFGVFVDPAVYKAMLYMILSLGTGIAYFTLAVTGVSAAAPMLVMIIGIPLCLLVLGMVRAVALFEGRLVEGLLGTRMPRRERATPPNMTVLERILFWVKDGRTWASMAYMIIMLPLGIFYFTVTVTGLSVGLGLISSVAWGWFGNWDFVHNGVLYHGYFPVWGIPLTGIGGVIVLVGTMHLIRAMGRGHAAFAKRMLVRLAK